MTPNRWRVSYSRNFRDELLFGRWLLEPIACVMDWGMLRGVKKCAEAGIKSETS